MVLQIHCSILEFLLSSNYLVCQVEVAVQDNAQRLYAFKFKSIAQALNASQLISLREAQLLYRLSDELAADIFREHTRKLVEQNISASLNLLKSRTRAGNRVIEELDKILAFNNLLISLKSHPDSSRFARGVGPVSLVDSQVDVNQ
ncbi:protein TIC110, chloroplastic-like isoform X2 [Henckelia pumila]|uniref:protein TIC110, chloroplastic-like isoform X2 n=1 Tax=Henckelia pumila TaxID=405737 RepID=UPI003C6E9C44